MLIKQSGGTNVLCLNRHKTNSVFLSAVKFTPPWILINTLPTQSVRSVTNTNKTHNFRQSFLRSLVRYTLVITAPWPAEARICFWTNNVTVKTAALESVHWHAHAHFCTTLLFFNVNLWSHDVMTSRLGHSVHLSSVCLLHNLSPIVCSMPTPSTICSFFFYTLIIFLSFACSIHNGI